jgi:hypothetical protein
MKAEVKVFDDSKVGVKGLVESGVTKIPHMFHTGKLDITKNLDSDSRLSVPIIDLKDIHANPSLRVEVIDQIRSACHEWGFFQMINHGIHVTVLDEMIDGIRIFHEQDADVRKKFYTHDLKEKFQYYSNMEPCLVAKLLIGEIHLVLPSLLVHSNQKYYHQYAGNIPYILNPNCDFDPAIHYQLSL